VAAGPPSSNAPRIQPAESFCRDITTLLTGLCRLVILAQCALKGGEDRI